MSKRSPSPRTVFLLALLVASLLALVVTKLREHPEQAPRVSKEEPLVWRNETKRKRRGVAHPGVLPGPDDECFTHASERCVDGDVWAFDSCGNREQKLEECGPKRCVVDECQSVLANGCLGPPEGVCVGERVELCLDGKPYSVDCAAQGMRCATGAEGAACAPIIPEALRCKEGAAYCDANVLFRCLEGRIERQDCGKLLSQCVTLPEAGATCLRPVVTLSSSCGPCGCITAGGGEEQACDGRDEDGDGLIDEELDCGPIPIVAIRVTSAGGGGQSEPDIRVAIGQLNQIFAATELPGALRFSLDSIVELPQADLMSMGEDDFKRLANDPIVHPPREGFYVPVVFTDKVLATGDVPKPGMSTLPNATCGGIQEGYGPDVGLIAVGRQRYPTTLAHEVGHFLGLCHTHDTLRAPMLGDVGAAQACQPLCSRDGDGICDTPLDPGPSLCQHDMLCQVGCAGGARPDATNLMSYYADCRETFSAQQMALMQHTAALRRGWTRCFGDNCACRLSGELDCPPGMGCRPRADVANAGRCQLEGPRGVREECSGMHDCRGNALCVRVMGSPNSYCARSCLTDSPDCECTATSDGLRICQQDMRL